MRNIIPLHTLSGCGSLIVHLYGFCLAIVLLFDPMHTASGASGCHDIAHADKTQCDAKAATQLPTLDAEGAFRARVQWVFDGDTLQVLAQGRSFDIRIAQIDAPERAQPYGWTAAVALIDHVRDREVRVLPTDIDRYGRVVAQVSVNGRDVGRELVAQGAAWCYVRRGERSPLLDLERQARKEHRGLWAQAQYMPPWEWRRRHRDVPRAATPK